MNETIECGLPFRLKETLDDYISKGFKPGGFVHAALAQDFIRAIQMCDNGNIRYLKPMVDYILEHVPPQARGSYAHVDYWLNKKR